MESTESLKFSQRCINVMDAKNPAEQQASNTGRCDSVTSLELLPAELEQHGRKHQPRGKLVGQQVLVWLPFTSNYSKALQLLPSSGKCDLESSQF